MSPTDKQCLVKQNFKFVRNNYPFDSNWPFDVKGILEETPVIIDPGVNNGDASVLYYRLDNQGSLSGRISKTHTESAYFSLLRSSKSLIAAENNFTMRLLSANSLLLYTFYSDFPELRRIIEKDIKAMGGCATRWRSSGRSSIVEKLIGWKLAKKISIWLP